MDKMFFDLKAALPLSGGDFLFNCLDILFEAREFGIGDDVEDLAKLCWMLSGIAVQLNDEGDSELSPGQVFTMICVLDSLDRRSKHCGQSELACVSLTSAFKSLSFTEEFSNTLELIPTLSEEEIFEVVGLYIEGDTVYHKGTTNE